MKNILSYSTLLSGLLISFLLSAQDYKQTSWVDKIKEEINRGIDSPEELGHLIFIALQNDVDLAPFYSRREVLSEMIAATGKKNPGTAEAAADYWWNDFQKERATLLDQFYETLKKKNIRMSEYMLDEVKAIVEDIPGTNGRVKSADIYLYIRKGNSRHVISLDDCGMINNRWYIMTPYIFLDAPENGQKK
jgi:predicted HTH domain antitoxin